MRTSLGRPKAATKKRQKWRFRFRRGCFIFNRGQYIFLNSHLATSPVPLVPLSHLFFLQLKFRIKKLFSCQRTCCPTCPTVLLVFTLCVKINAVHGRCWCSFISYSIKYFDCTKKPSILQQQSQKKFIFLKIFSTRSKTLPQRKTRTMRKDKKGLATGLRRFHGFHRFLKLNEKSFFWQDKQNKTGLEIKNKKRTTN